MGWMHPDELFAALSEAATRDEPPALLGTAGSVSHRQLGAAVETAAAELRAHDVRVLASVMDNGPGWVTMDLAALRAAVVHVPLPPFFTPAQHAHALDACAADALLVPDSASSAFTALGFRPAQAWSDGVTLLRRRVPEATLPAGTAKITFTSGTTGNPKGVCLSAQSMLSVARGIAEATAPLRITRHLCALPFAVLLENVAGVLAPLLRGGTCVVLPCARAGLTGSSTFDPATLHEAVVEHAAQSVILLPQMLRRWAAWLQARRVAAPATLRLVAVGGAAVGTRALEQARALGLPAYEGYGLSEGASVQTLNLPHADRPGSAGRALPHARLRVAADGEIEIGGTLFLGYLGERAPAGDWWRSGDLGEIDADGYVHVRGRRKNVLITAFGRNVSPEWVETALRGEAAIAQAAVFGEGEPALSAVLWPAAPDLPDAAIASAVAAANAGLPDYARVLRWIRAQAPFDAQHGMATVNGRPRRAAIEARHRDALHAHTGRSNSDPLLINEQP
jgi:long-subunit acyl-CoA synthetase (AMP-forming)